MLHRKGTSQCFKTANMTTEFQFFVNGAQATYRAIRSESARSSRTLRSTDTLKYASFACNPPGRVDQNIEGVAAW